MPSFSVQGSQLLSTKLDVSDEEYGRDQKRHYQDKRSLLGGTLSKGTQYIRAPYEYKELLHITSFLLQSTPGRK